MADGFWNINCLVVNATNLTQAVGEDDGANEDKYSNFILIGCLLELTGDIISTFGILFQKKAHNNYHEKLAKENPDSHELNQDELPFSWIWFLGIFCTLFAGVLYIGAVTFAPISIIMPLSASQLVFNQFLGRYYLGERLSRTEIYASAVLIVGIVMTCVATAVQAREKTVCDILTQYKKPEIRGLALGVYLPLFIISYAIVRVDKEKLNKTLLNARCTLYALAVSIPISFYFSSLRAMGAFFLAEDPGFEEIMKTYFPYVHLIGALLCGIVLFFKIVNEALSQYDAVEFNPRRIVLTLVLGSIWGSIFFEEYADYETWRFILWGLGVTIICAGVVYLASVNRNQEKDVLESEYLHIGNTKVFSSRALQVATLSHSSFNFNHHNASSSKKLDAIDLESTF